LLGPISTVCRELLVPGTGGKNFAREPQRYTVVQQSPPPRCWIKRSRPPRVCVNSFTPSSSKGVTNEHIPYLLAPRRRTPFQDPSSRSNRSWRSTQHTSDSFPPAGYADSSREALTSSRQTRRCICKPYADFNEREPKTKRSGCNSKRPASAPGISRSAGGAAVCRVERRHAVPEQCPAIRGSARSLMPELNWN